MSFFRMFISGMIMSFIYVYDHGRRVYPDAPVIEVVVPCPTVMIPVAVITVVMVVPVIVIPVVIMPVVRTPGIPVNRVVSPVPC